MTVNPSDAVVVDTAEQAQTAVGPDTFEDSYNPAEVIPADLPASVEAVIEVQPIASAEDADQSGLSNY